MINLIKIHFRPITLFTFLLFVISCSTDNSVVESDSDPSNGIKNLTILYTNDEHGWMEPYEQFGGAAGMMGLWRDVEGYTEDSPFLILSGGDMWTGPALSTWFEGESMVEVMNAMGYDAAAIGNHEVDFGIDKLIEHSNNSNFPFLSANIVLTGTTNSPEWCQPYLIKQVNGISVGIIGLTTNRTPNIVFPEYVENLDFISYEDALNRVVPQIRSEGAELLILISHMGSAEMRNITSLASQLGIVLIGGGHTNELINETHNGVRIIEGGSYMRSYSKAEISYNTETAEVISITSDFYENTGGTYDPQIENIVSTWQSEAAASLNEVIGFVSVEIVRSSDAMYNLITDSWLYSFPYSDISISNTGGVRQSIPAGDITVATIMGVLPFENDIVELEINGSNLIQLIESIINYNFVGGMTTIGGYTLTDGSQIDANETYLVLTTDYMYSTTELYQQYDPEPNYTYINWRQPVIDYIRSLNTSSGDPLDNYLDYIPRQRHQLLYQF